MVKLLLSVFVGSGIGGVLRFVISGYINRLSGSGSLVALFPWATLTVNIIGCFIIGLVYGLIDNGAISLSAEAKAFVTAGFCGGLTTFSTFSHENFLLFQSDHPGLLLLYAAASLITGFAAAYLGHAMS